MNGVRELLCRAPLPATQKHLLHVMLHHSRNQRECWPSERRLQEAMSLGSRQTLSTHKKALRALGILDWLRPEHPENPKSCAIYSISWEALQALVESHLQPPSSRKHEPSKPALSLVTSTPDASSRTGAAENPLPVAASTMAAPTMAAVPGTEEAEAQGCSPVEALPEWPCGEQDVALTLDEALWEPSIEASTVLPAVAPLERAPEENPASTPEEDLAVTPEQDLDLAPEAQTSAPLPEPAATVPPVELLAPGVLAEVVPSEAVSHEAEAALPEPAAPATAAPGATQPSSSFEVPLALVWKLWTETYLQVYGWPYAQTGADRAASQQIARACAAAVLHHERRAGLEASEREAQAQEYLRHVFRAFLKRPGRKDFLRDRRHPLSLLPADLNALGEPWRVAPKVVEKPAPLPPPLPREEQVAWCQKVKQALNGGRVARPRIVKKG
ncbi:MAG: helix-turn-helix domain-containing protein [Polyangiaceae bacterium]|jgi:hypothetical protein|nr:helix-turn-helix domain-containing protein [Polyangiaceae bacterium]